MQINILERLDKDDEYYEVYEILKDKTYHLKEDSMFMGFNSILTNKRVEIEIKFSIKNNIITIHNYEEIESFQKHYHEKYLITESVINSIIEEFALSLRYRENRVELGLKLEIFEEEDKEETALEILSDLNEFEMQLNDLLTEGRKIVEKLNFIEMDRDASQFELYFLNRIKSFLEGNEMFKFSSLYEELNNAIKEDE